MVGVVIVGKWQCDIDYTMVHVVQHSPAMPPLRPLSQLYSDAFIRAIRLVGDGELRISIASQWKETAFRFPFRQIRCDWKVRLYQTFNIILWNHIREAYISHIAHIFPPPPPPPPTPPPHPPTPTPPPHPTHPPPHTHTYTHTHTHLWWLLIIPSQLLLSSTAQLHFVVA